MSQRPSDDLAAPLGPEMFVATCLTCKPERHWKGKGTLNARRAKYLAQRHVDHHMQRRNELHLVDAQHTNPR